MVGSNEISLLQWYIFRGHWFMFGGVRSKYNFAQGKLEHQKFQKKLRFDFGSLDEDVLRKCYIFVLLEKNRNWKP